jgi:hypothetical protein
MKLISVKSMVNGRTYYIERLPDDLPRKLRKEYGGGEYWFVDNKRDATRFLPEDTEEVLRRLNYETAGCDNEFKVIEEPWLSGIRIVARA